MSTEFSPPRRRGRPPKVERSDADTRRLLIRSGVETLTEQGLAASSLDLILKRVSVPKGSFYHYFENKEAFGKAILEEYGSFFDRKLRRVLRNQARSPLDRIDDFVNEAIAGMEKFDWQRGCLVGNLGQEITVLPESFRDQIEAIFATWQHHLACCLQEAQQQGSISVSCDCDAMATFFWIGWEGAVMRARLSRDSYPLTVFVTGFLSGIRT
ncbi:TetR/AcrR family transcriptional regulator [Pseudomonas putida]|uniref:acrylate utilization transcriptional regulator AcuR n=1 Tax=Pseudomonas putida TaxID=303 RepID=UPI000E6B2CC6|nr:TetR/AcrR family transcriptional regulator [Pseudomonas putida]RIZ40702.1 TetR family transcriptional regulator [Pseudomonas putida]